MPEWTLRVLEAPNDMRAVEELQRAVWPGSETDVVPLHLLRTAAHNGGLIAGAYVGEQLVGMVFGFPGLESTPDGPRPKHCSHMMGVLPEYRDSGLGFALKRAQWQMVRQQGVDHITWTYDPLLSRNAYLNIGKLGAVCNTYIPAYYGDMRDGLNVGLPSDRFQVDWWLFTKRVERRLGQRPRRAFGLDHFLQADVQPLYAAASDHAQAWVRPPEVQPTLGGALLLAEIPADFMTLKAEDMFLASAWRMFSRDLFMNAFDAGYLITDFVFDRSSGRPRSFYVLAHGESTLESEEHV
jgi:predicted GNAT superfamily acetyltransferase